MNSDDFFEQTELPKRVAVCGAGYIAVELAGIYKALGSDVSLCVRRERALRNFDAMLTDQLDKAMRKQGIRIENGFTPSEVSREPESGKLTLSAEDSGKTPLSGLD